MVRIYTRVIKKRYLDRKRVYEHRHIAIPIPKKLHDLLQPFLGKDLNINITAHPSQLTIILTPKPDPSKNTSSRRTHPRKNQHKNHTETV